MSARTGFFCLAAALVAASCGASTAPGVDGGFVARATTLTFDPASREFWALPLPSDLRRREDGTLGLTRYPGPRPALVEMWLKTADKRLADGWGVSSGIFFTTSGALDAASLPQQPGDARTAEASVYLVDVDAASPEYGRRFPLWVEFTADAIPFAPKNVLAAIPGYGFVRRPLTTYAVVVTDSVKDKAGAPLGRSEAFHKAFEKASDADPKAAASFEPLRVWLAKEKRDAARVVGATVFKTMDPSSILLKLADWIEKQPEPSLSGSWKVEQNYESFQLLTGRYTVPSVQEGGHPGEGLILYDGGVPVQTGSQSVRLSLSIPKAPMPPGGFPLMIYFHGSGGEFREPIDRGPRAVLPKKDAPQPAPGTGPAEWLARRGVAAMGFDFPLHGDRSSPPDTTGLKLYNLFGDIDTTVDNMQVGVMEVIYLTRLIPTLQIPESLAATLNAGGKTNITFDLNRLTGMGHSMGSTFGMPIASVASRFQGFVFSGAGGSLVEIANSATEPVNIKPNLELLLGYPETPFLKRSHPLLHLFQNLWDFCDPTAKARYVAREPRPGMKPRPFFMTAGVRDGYFHPYSESATAVALGATLVGAEVEPEVPAALALDGRTSQPYPLKNNLNGVTAGVAMYAVPYDLGHYVAFDREDTRTQYTCFVAGVGTDAGPHISPLAAVDAGCL